MLIAPAVYAFGKAQDVLVRVGHGERSQLTGREPGAEYLGRVVLLAMIGDELAHVLRYFFVVEVEVVLGKSLFVNVCFVVVAVFTVTMVMFRHIYS